MRVPQTGRPSERNIGYVLSGYLTVCSAQEIKKVFHSTRPDLFSHRSVIRLAYAFRAKERTFLYVILSPKNPAIVQSKRLVNSIAPSLLRWILGERLLRLEQAMRLRSSCGAATR